MIDTHCHLSDPRVSAEKAEEFITASKAKGITRLIMGGISPSEWDRQNALSEKFPEVIVPVFGLHPWWVSQNADEGTLQSAFNDLKIRLPHAAALGELGLDYTSRFSDSERLRQRKFFEAQLGLALHAQKPLVLHVVRAHLQALESIAQIYGNARSPGIVHGFSGSWQEAKGYLARGLSISLGGAVTWKTSRPKVHRKLSEVAHQLPLEHLLIESDTPDQAPEGALEGQEHGPLSILRIADEIALIRGVSASSLLEASAENARRIFGLSK